MQTTCSEHGGTLYMLSASSPESGSGMSRKTKTCVVVLVVAVLVLAPLSAFFYWQANDYRGAKYRSQAVLVSTCIGAVNGIVGGIPGMYDNSLPITNRSWIAERTHECLWDLYQGSEAIGQMYNSDGNQGVTFATLKTAAELMTFVIKRVSWDMWQNVTLSSPYVENDTMRANALLTVPRFLEIDNLLMNASDPQRDWEDGPYSLVNRMDLDAIRLASELIIELATPLQPHR
jgi:hypothetical protein